ncbi:unnamed protein product [Cercospora beticola]|nr:unnamed protein product [Cercospora beticola]
MADQRYIFSNKELEVYFDRICLPEHKRVYDVTGLSNDDQLEFLHLLQKHQLVKVPWENLTQHYSWHKVINCKPKHLFRKIVRQPGRGGYCMEANLFFHHILLSLKFDVYMCGSRIFHAKPQTYGGFTHVVNLVTIAGTKYLLDGGFGAQGPSRPMPLHHREVLTQIYPAQMRLIFDTIPQNLNSSHKVWQYQFRYSSPSPRSSPATSPDRRQEPWQTMYCFPDIEFLPADIEAMNLEPWLSPHTFLTHKVVAVRFTTALERNGTKGPASPYETELEGEIDGAIVLNHDVLKWRRRGQKVAEIPFRCEADRVEALGMYFGITLSEEDLEGIKGTAAEIGAGALTHG